MAPSGRVVVRGGDAPTVTALRTLIAEAQRDDPLAPVDVVVPTSFAGVTLRRAVAAGGGLANVRFPSLPQLAERLSARHLAVGAEEARTVLTSTARSIAVRAAIAGLDPTPGSLAAAGRHRATAELLEGLAAELDDAGVDGHTGAPLSARGQEVLELHRAYRGHLGAALPEARLLEVAVEALAAGSAPDTHVVLVAPGRRTRAEDRLLAALHAAGRLSVLCCDAQDTAWAAELLGQQVAPPAEGAATAYVDLVVAPDPEEEVRLAVRSVLAHLQENPARPDRIGIAFTSSRPFARLLAEQLSTAGLPHHVPGQRTLAQTVAGRTLIGLLELHRRGYPRADVSAFFASGPLLTADGTYVPASTWERVSRTAGATRGLSTWRQRLDRFEQQGPRHTGDEESIRQVAAARSLRLTLDGLAAAAEAALGAPTWAHAAEALRVALRVCLGDRRSVDGWTLRAEADLQRAVELEQQAHDAVDTALGALAQLDATGQGPDAAAVRDAVTDALGTAAPSATVLGRGILVGPVREFAGADLDLLLVLGLSEDAAPARQREHPVLRDADRELLSPDLATLASRRADEQRAWRAALRTAPQIVLSCARANSRTQRRQFASPWFLEQASLRAGRPVGAGEVDSPGSALPGLRSYDSFVDALDRGGEFTSVHELDAARTVLAGAVDELAAADPRLQRGLVAARARARGEFGPWTGGTEELPEGLRERVDRGHSATSLERWATCPARHLFRDVLRVGRLEEAAEHDSVSPADRGSLLHDVLEEFLRPHLGTPEQPGRSPDAAWTPEEVQAALDLLDTHVARLERRGGLGRHPALWPVQLRELRRQVADLLAADSARRAAERSWPIAVEAAFGDEDALVLDLPTQGALRLSGRIDRIDATAAGGLVVQDYKSGKSSSYGEFPKRGAAADDTDLTDRGRRLQLPLYALAARSLTGNPAAAVEAYYTFTPDSSQRGAAVGPQQERRFLDVLDVTVGGIRAGTYPANPGAETYGGWQSCRYCDYDRVCPTTRGEQWEQVRTDEAVRAYARLADPGPPEPPEDGQ
ncbi:PD-(D/E)XK nuclease family protein [Kineococcus radiotolerans]|uniref:ATP-dependent nuclease subunit B-like n=1 Tax=Kineococcus radiotolerans (strain ATCC BAA-149 / DSM 14245 / SRS30216) TaxID=266940 RepID=A6WGC7_KINRD|nr:PD-(D/E)XK nuclease family protein [Kineococcus radiotolerans]ABS05866.1 ATP-dependent nuclease subunit B-like [Kineococcus radiotolerans SRS30216 = ATCC BAA-149]